MCLASMNTQMSRDPSEIVVGYKALCKSSDGELRLPYFTVDGRDAGSRRVPTDIWLQSNNTQIVTDSHDSYPSGFHVFQWREDAERWGRVHCGKSVVVVEVEVRNIVAEGRDGGFRAPRVLVAKEMKVSCPKQVI